MRENYRQITEAEAWRRGLIRGATATTTDGVVRVCHDVSEVWWRPVEQLPDNPRPLGWRGGMWAEQHLE